MSYDGTSNIAVAYLKDTGKTVDDYDGDCDKLASDIIEWAVDEFVDVIYMEPARWGKTLPCPDEFERCWHPDEWTWDWHMAIILDGVVHDAWFPDFMLSPCDYLAKAFPGVEIEFNIQSHTIRPKCILADKIKTSR